MTDWRSAVEFAGKPNVFELDIPGVGKIHISKEAPLPTRYRVLRTDTDARQKFWLARSWPSDAMGKVFLGNALLRIGRAMFPDAWSDFEPSVNTTLSPLPLFHFGLRPWELRAAIGVLPAYTSFPPLGQRKGVSRDNVVQADWDAARVLRNEVLAEIEGPRQRLIAVQTALRTALLPKVADGEADLRYYCRVDATGDYAGPLPGKWWNTEMFLSRFYWCKMNQKTPITVAVGGDGFQWLFVDADDLARLEEKLTPRRAPGNKAKPDDDALEAMLALMDGPGRLSATAASKEVAKTMKDEQSVTSAARRILGKFKDKHPNRVKAYAPR